MGRQHLCDTDLGPLCLHHTPGQLCDTEPGTHPFWDSVASSDSLQKRSFSPMTVDWPQGIKGWGRLICGRSHSHGGPGWAPQGAAVIGQRGWAAQSTLEIVGPWRAEQSQGVKAFPGEQGLACPHPLTLTSPFCPGPHPPSPSFALAAIPAGTLALGTGQRPRAINENVGPSVSFLSGIRQSRRPKARAVCLFSWCGRATGSDGIPTCSPARGPGTWHLLVLSLQS